MTVIRLISDVSKKLHQLF